MAHTLYETMLLITPELAETAATKEVELFKKRITEGFEGAISFEDFWGKRDLAYSIKKKTQGFYCVIQYTFPGQEMREFDEELRLNQNILRHMTVKPPKDEEKPLTYEEILKEEEDFKDEKIAGKRKVRKISSRKEALDIKK